MDLGKLNSSWPRCTKYLSYHNYKIVAICETDTPNHYAVHYKCSHCQARFMDKSLPESQEILDWIANATENTFLDGKFYYTIPDAADER